MFGNFKCTIFVNVSSKEHIKQPKFEIMSNLAKEVLGFQTDDKVFVFHLQNRYKEVLEMLKQVEETDYSSPEEKATEKYYFVGQKHLIEKMIVSCLSVKAQKEVLAYVS